MQTNDSINGRKKTALVIVNNEILLSALKKVMERLGYEVRQDIESSKSADLGFVGIYFAFLGIVKQIRAVNPVMPIILVLSAEHGSDAGLELSKNFYDVIALDDNSEVEITQKMTRWFSEGQGKYLLERGDAKGTAQSK